MVRICPRVHFYEIDDQKWFPGFLREKVQSCLTLAWTFKAPLVQKTSPAQLVATTLRRVLSKSIHQYTYIDFCAGAGGPTPFIEKDLNAQLENRESNLSNSENGRERDLRDDLGAVKFVLTDLHPHIPDWTEASRKSQNLSFISRPVDAANAPPDLISRDGKKTFRLFNLAFHHFENKLAKDILRNTLETADGFGIFELQDRTFSSFITIILLGFLMFLAAPFYFWHDPSHLFFTFIIPIIPFVVVFDGLVSSVRTRSPAEIEALMKECGATADGWTIKSGNEQHTWPTGYLTWVIGVKE